MWNENGAAGLAGARVGVKWKELLFGFGLVGIVVVLLVVVVGVGLLEEVKEEVRGMEGEREVDSIVSPKRRRARSSPRGSKE